MPDKTLLFIHALTGLHPGSGTALGVVDLPVQRERHTDWPQIPGSSLKGVLRAECARDNRSDEAVLAAFGPETAAASDHAGAASFSDARILAFPVRSLTGVFAWVTCQDVLTRLSRDLGLVGGGELPVVPPVDKDKAACRADSPLLAHGQQLMLEEFEFSRDAGGEKAEEVQKVADWIAEQCVKDKATQERLRSHLVILHNDDFTHFVRNATEVVARVGLDYEKKTVRKGALFYEEYLPAETLFYSLVICSDSRRETCKKTAADILGWLCDTAPETIQIGGGETVGKGFCAVRFAHPAKEGQQ